MAVRKGTVWTDKDFSELGWNSCRLYAVVLPGRRHELKLILDYSLHTPQPSDMRGIWELVPVELLFQNVVDLEICLRTEKLSEIDIINIVRENRRPTPNSKHEYEDYRIYLSNDGILTFAATGFKQIATADSAMSSRPDLDRE